LRIEKDIFDVINQINKDFEEFIFMGKEEFIDLIDNESNVENEI